MTVKSIAQLQQELDRLINSKATNDEVMDKVYELASCRLTKAIDKEILDTIMKESGCQKSK